MRTQYYQANGGCSKDFSRSFIKKGSKHTQREIDY